MRRAPPRVRKEHIERGRHCSPAHRRAQSLNNDIKHDVSLGMLHCLPRSEVESRMGGTESHNEKHVTQCFETPPTGKEKAVSRRAISQTGSGALHQIPSQLAPMSPFVLALLLSPAAAFVAGPVAPMRRAVASTAQPTMLAGTSIRSPIQ